MLTYFKNNKAFTLLELIVVITIFGIMLLATYIPYSYYQTKAKVKMAVKDISQNIYESRNMAINWYNEGSGSLSIGLFFDVITNPQTITFFSYPFSYTGTQIIPKEGGGIKIIKKEELPDGVELESIWWYKKWLLFFSAISWAWFYYYWDASGVRKEFPEGYIDINISYRKATWKNLRGIIKYYTPTNIVDY